MIINSGGSSSDYLTNLYDQWSANRNPVINDAMTEMIGWTGYTNAVMMNRTGAPALFANGICTPDGVNDGFSIAWGTSLQGLPAPPSLSGAVTFVFLIQKSAQVTNLNPLWDSNNTTSPRVVLMLERSNSDNKPAIRYNGVNYVANSAFDYDADYHVLGFRMDGANTIANIWLDGVQISSDFAITGGGVNFTSGTSWFFRSLADSRFGSFSIKRMRIYNEYVSDENMEIISTGDFTQPITDNTPVHVLMPFGQSNVGPDSSNNERADWPADCRTGLTDAYIFEYFSDRNRFVSIADDVTSFIGGTGTSSIFPGPFLSAVRDLKIKFPGHRIVVAERYVGGTSLAVQWNSNPVGTAYQLWIDNIPCALKTLLIEQRNIVTVTAYWIHGEEDATVQADSLAYYINFTDFAVDVEARIAAVGIGVTVKWVVSALSSRSGGTYRVNVKTGQTDFVADNPTLRSLIDTEDAGRYPFMDSVHYSPVGLESDGEDCAGFIEL